MATALASNGTASACSTATINYPDLFGAKFYSLEATYIANYSEAVHPGFYTNHGAVDVVGANFCNVTVTYTHPGQNDTINVQVWLPTADSWNGRMQAIGGGGWQAGLYLPALMGMAGAVGQGYASLSTDAGLGSAVYPSSWGLLSQGNPNLYLLQDLASVSLNDASIIGKSIINSFYGQPPTYSYFSGCSQGGRQGLMLAQRYPEAYDGIAASAPAINWSEFFAGDYFPSLIMDQLGEYPYPCEFDALTAAAVAACDGNDGLIDGILSNETCTFDPQTLVGTTINCTDTGLNLQISSAAAIVAQAAWTGAQKADNSSLWFGVNKDAVLTSPTAVVGTSIVTSPSLAGTVCSTNGTCVKADIELSTDWIKLFVLKDATADLSNLTRKEYERLFLSGVQQYSSIIDTNDPDLSEFRNRGGKMITYHGMADTLISPYGTKKYYDAVTALDADVQDFYRLFFAPGLGHCFGGEGAYPDDTFDAMRKWVEDGVAPDTLNATSVGTTPIISRPLCPYPQVQYYDGNGNSSSADAFYCK